jgi:Tfp pilus assembly protein PilE
MKGMGFTGEGNLEGNKPLYEEEDGEESAKQEVEEELSEGEAALKYVDEMLERYYSTNEELKGGQSKLDVNKNGKLDSDDFKKLRGDKSMEEAEEMSPEDKKFAALAEPKDKITYADKIAGATKEGLKKKV